MAELVPARRGQRWRASDPDALTSRLAEWLRVHGPATTERLVRAFAGEKSSHGYPLTATRIGVALVSRQRSLKRDVVREGRLWRWVPAVARDGLPGAREADGATGDHDGRRPRAERVQLVAPEPRRYAGAAEFAVPTPRAAVTSGAWVPPRLVLRPGALAHQAIASRVGDSLVPYAGAVGAFAAGSTSSASGRR